jgi:hypothetical protein
MPLPEGTSTSRLRPAQAGAAGVVGGGGGNAGLVILSYVDPSGTCSL